jgi:hypothetical protein
MCENPPAQATQHDNCVVATIKVSFCYHRAHAEPFGVIENKFEGRKKKRM